MGSMSGFKQYKIHQSSQILHTWHLEHKTNQILSKVQRKTNRRNSKSKTSGVEKVQHVLLAATCTWHFSIIQWPAQWPALIPTPPTRSVISPSATTFRHKLQEMKEQTDQGWLILCFWSWPSKQWKAESPPAVHCALHPATVSVFHLNYSAHPAPETPIAFMYTAALMGRGDKIRCKRCYIIENN